ncbi:MAG: T9SS type A sorting domain-containing protein [Flavobacteriaceae bacterium]|nr:T9SS type A sorting domain-containing protein [Flavobacteriaceae bacterium]
MPRSIKASSANLYMYGADIHPAVGGTNRHIGYSTDGGNTWTNKQFAPTGLAAGFILSDVFPVSATTLWAVTAPSATSIAQNGVWKSTDAGTTWTKMTGMFTNAAGSFADVVYFWDANNGFVAGDAPGANAQFEMYRTTDGATWTAIPNTPTAFGTVQPGIEGAYTGMIQVLGDDIWLGTTSGRILHTPDRGTTWDTQVTPCVDFGGAIVDGAHGSYAFKDANNGLIIETQGGITSLWGKVNGGDWEPIDDSGFTGWYDWRIVYIPGTENTYVTVGENASTGLQGSAYTTDGGLTWTEIPQTDPAWAGPYGENMCFFDGTSGVLGGYSQLLIGGIPTADMFKFNGDLTMAVKDVAVKSNLQIYPNPTSDVVKISANNDIRSIAIFDMSGKLVKTFAGAKEINVSSLAKGNYVLQVHYVNGGVENTKLIRK